MDEASAEIVEKLMVVSETAVRDGCREVIDCIYAGNYAIASSILSKLLQYSMNLEHLAAMLVGAN